MVVMEMMMIAWMEGMREVSWKRQRAPSDEMPLLRRRIVRD